MPPKRNSTKKAVQAAKPARRNRRNPRSGRDPITALSIVGRSVIADFTNAGKQGSIAGFAFTAGTHALPAVRGAYTGNAAPSFFVHFIAWIRAYIAKSKLGPFLDGAMAAIVEHVDQLWGALIISLAILLSRYARRDGVALIAFAITVCAPAQSTTTYLAIAAALYLYSLPLWAPYRWGLCAALLIYACAFSPAPTSAWTYQAPTSFWGA